MNVPENTAELSELLLDATPYAVCILPSNNEQRQASSESKSRAYKKQPWKKRYASSLKQLAPVRFSRKATDRGKMPGPARGFINMFTLHWVSCHMWKAFRGTLRVENLWNLRDEDSSRVNYERLLRQWTRELDNRGAAEASLMAVLFRTFRTRIIFSSFSMIIAVILQFIGPSVLLAALLDFVADDSATLRRGIELFVAIVACQIVRTYCFYGLSYTVSAFTSFRAACALQMMVYNKLFRLGQASDQLLGRVVNICVSDMDRLYEAFTAGPLFFGALVMFVFALVFNISVLGVWSLLGFFIILLCYPMLGALAAVTSQLRSKVVRLTDRRVNLISEIISAIRLIKMYAWEDSFEKSVLDVRRQEQIVLQRGAFLQSASNTVAPIVGVVAALATILGYVLSGNQLSPGVAFATVAVFNAMQFSIGTLPYSIRMVMELKVALIRMQKLMLLPEAISALEQGSNPIGTLEIEHGTFVWERMSIDTEKKSEKNGQVNDKANGAKSSPPRHDLQSDPSGTVASTLSHQRDTDDTEGHPAVALSDICVTIGRGQLVGVAGSVGAGKSTLLAAFMSQVRKVSGRVLCGGRVAVVPQVAWIFSATLRDNILLGSEFDEGRYNRALDVCALRSDLQQLENGDLSEIGERGVNLSGGQKQRVSLARAVYADADIYFLDDPLSAVDAKVGRHMFDHCIAGALRDKTVLLVSHGVQYLSRCDEVLMMADGRIVERGTHAELLAQRSYYQQLVMHDSSTDDHSHTTSAGQKHDNLQEVGETKESRGEVVDDHVPRLGFLRLLYMYARVCGGVAMVAVLSLVALFGVGRNANIIYLQHWLDQGDGLRAERQANSSLYNITYSSSELVGFINDNPDLFQHVAIYCGIIGVLIIIGIVKGVGIALLVIRGATRLHHRMFKGMLRCRMAFFDQNPSGRILNRFSRDMDEMDNKIPMLLEFLVQGGFMILVQYLIPTVSFPLMIVVVIIISCVYLFLSLSLAAGIEVTKQSENAVRAPLVHHLTSSVNGLSTIRVFQRQQVFTNRFEGILDRYTSACLEHRLATLWFSMRVEETSTLVLAAVAALVVWSALDGRRVISSAAAGLIVTSVYGWITFLSFWMRLFAELTARLTSVERCEHYISSLQPELIVSDTTGTSIVDNATNRPNAAACCVSDEWPCSGELELRQVCLRYGGSSSPRVLHSVSLHVTSGHKIGVVGRTGAGKSSLVSVLLRLVELESGVVLIDGVSVAAVPLWRLRSSVDVIPQDPVLFSGTIRYNLDPFDKYDDAALWNVLEKVKLKEKVSRSKTQLEMRVSSAGDNFSVGERQLICLARAMLRRNRILLLDEATASVDVETDHLIQKTIRDNFCECTVMTIAHRLNTIVNYDKVLVMDSGKVVEFDCPSKLMSEEDSLFRRMMADSGVQTLQQFNSLQES